MKLVSKVFDDSNNLILTFDDIPLDVVGLIVDVECGNPRAKIKNQYRDVIPGSTFEFVISGVESMEVTKVTARGVKAEHYLYEWSLLAA